ncbi:hypothetical protein ACPPVW_18290 [Leifsonia sp. McL0607]|uniref:hypothetical protein n=1 Tax=Leifsonia sp. McL0607 TaxID=3415672 RepID=UPI003CF2FD9D
MPATVTALNSRPRVPMKEATLQADSHTIPVTATPALLGAAAVAAAFGIGVLIGAAVK